MGWSPISPWKFVVGGAQKVPFTSASASSAAIGATTRSETRAILVRVTTDAHIRITTANEATAVTTDWLIRSSDPPLVFGCTPGDLVSVIQDASAGYLSLQELTH